MEQLEDFSPDKVADPAMTAPCFKERYNCDAAPGMSLQAVLLTTVVLLDMVGHFLAWPWSLDLASWLTIPAFVLAFPAMSRLVQVTSVVLLSGGAGILLATGAGSELWTQALRSMTGVFGLVVFVRLLGLPWELGGYRQNVAEFFSRNSHRPRLVYTVAAIFAYLLSNVLIVGAVPVTGQMLKETVADSGALPVRFVTRAASVGFVMALFFTPITPLQALSMQASNARWLDVMPLGFLLSLAGVALNVALGVWELKPAWAAGSAAGREPTDLRPLAFTALHFLLAMAGTAGATLVGQLYLSVPCFYVIALVVMLTSSFWSLFLRQPTGYLRGVLAYATRGVSRNATEFGLLFSAGLLSVALKQLHPEHLVLSLLTNLEMRGLEPLVYPLIIILVWGCSFTGVHPLALLAIVSGALQTSLSVLNVPAYYVALVAGAAFSYLSSPFSISLMILAGLVGSNTLELGLKWNRPFLATFMPAVMAITALVALLS